MFANPALKAVIRNQFFSRGKMDVRTYKAMVDQKAIPGEVFALAATVVSQPAIRLVCLYLL